MGSNPTLSATSLFHLKRLIPKSFQEAHKQSGWVRAEWAVTEASRKAKYYSLTAAGRKQLAAREKNWEQVVKGVQAILRYA